MKIRIFINYFFIFLLLLLIRCTVEEEYKQSVGEKNADLLHRVLHDSEIEFVDIYEYNWSTGNWDMIAENLTYCASGCESEQIYIYDVYFVLDDATGGASHSSGKYYLNLEYLVYFNIGVNDDELDLYFSYPKK